MSRFNAAPRYQRLVELQDAYLDQVDAILGGLATPDERLASVEEIRRQIGCLLAEMIDRKRLIQADRAAQTILDQLNRPRMEEDKH
jgi:hypothetical protein